LELIVVDSASDHFEIPDLSYNIRSSFYSLPVPGLSLARNFALSRAQGEIIALIDDDAIVDKNWLTQGTRHFETPVVACVTGRILPMELHSVWQEKLLATGWFPTQEQARSFDATNFNRFRDSPGTGSNLFIRKAFLEKHSFPEMLGPGTAAGAADEHYLFHKIIREGNTIEYEPEAIVYHNFVSTRDGYRKQMFRHGKSRGAFFTRFLLEKGTRAQTIRHILSRDRSYRTGPPARSLDRWLGLLAGPAALLLSYAQSARNSKQKVEGKLLRQFP
jgi:glycosyltransferase involved in cell wall biosynthesis